MKRREFIALVGGAAAAWPLLARAQSTTPRIGYFGPDPTKGPLAAAIYQAFMDEIQLQGFTSGQNFALEYRRLEQDEAALSRDVAGLLQLNVDAFFTDGTEPVLRAVVNATRTVPVVMIATNFDPFARGYVKSLARPEGNITGVFLRQTELAEKQTELLLDAVPGKQRLGILWDAISADQMAAAERRAKIFGMQVVALKLEHPPYDFDQAFRTLAENSPQMLLVLSSPFFTATARKLQIWRSPTDSRPCAQPHFAVRCRDFLCAIAHGFLAHTLVPQTTQVVSVVIGLHLFLLSSDVALALSNVPRSHSCGPTFGSCLGTVDGLDFCSVDEWFRVARLDRCFRGGPLQGSAYCPEQDTASYRYGIVRGARYGRNCHSRPGQVGIAHAGDARWFYNPELGCEMVGGNLAVLRYCRHFAFNERAERLVSVAQLGSHRNGVLYRSFRCRRGTLQCRLVYRTP
jgi:putative ABC transport system substrate-binding protein